MDTCLCGRPGLREPWYPGPVFPRPVSRSLYLLVLWGHLQHRLRLARGPRGHACAAPRGLGGSPGVSRWGAPLTRGPRVGAELAAAERAAPPGAVRGRRGEPRSAPAPAPSARAPACSGGGMLTSTAVETLRVSGPSVAEQLSAIIANKTSCARGRNQLFCYRVTGLEDRSEVGRKRCGEYGE